MDTSMLQAALVCLILWLAGLAFLWNSLRSKRKLVALRNAFVIDALMLCNMATLLLGISFLVIGSGWFG